MPEITYICIYLDYIHTLENLSDAARGKLLMAMLKYAASGEAPALTGPAKILWPMLQDQIDRDGERYRERCEKNRRNGRKGGRPRKKPKGFEKTQEEREGEEKEERE